MERVAQSYTRQLAAVLPCTFQPGEGELLSSWLVRLAHAHQVKVYSFCKHLWPNVAIWNRDIDKLAPAHIIDTLATRTLTSHHRIAQTTLAPIMERLTGELPNARQGHVDWLMPVGVYHRTHQSHGLMYCPRCLQRDGSSPYYRANWRFAFHVVCPTCSIYLHEGCPACGAPVNFFRIELGRKSDNADRPISTCYRCAFDLSQAPARAASAATVHRYRSLYRISRQGWNSSAPYPHQYMRVLRQLLRLLVSSSHRARPLQTSLRLRFGWPFEEPKAPVTFEQMPIAKRICLLEQAMWLLDSWPTRFVTVMRRHELNSAFLFNRMSGQVPFWFDSVVREFFWVKKINRYFRPLPSSRSEEQGHIITSIDGPISCPRCSSRWITRNGIRRGKRQYKCEQCNRHFR